MLVNTADENKNIKSEIDLNRSVEIIMRAGKISLWRYDVKERKFYSILGAILMQDGTTYESCAESLTASSRAEYHRLFNNLISGISRNESTIFHFVNTQAGINVYYRSELTVDLDDDGNVVSVLGTQTDITEDVLQKKVLEEFKIKTDLINEKNYIIQWDFDIDNQIVTTKGKGAIGVDFPMSVETYVEYVHPENKEEARLVFSQMANREITSFDSLIRAYLPGFKDYRYLGVSGVALHDKDGNIVSYTGIRRDVTHDHMQHKELLEKRYKTDLMEKASGLYLWEYDCERGVFISDDTSGYGVEQTFQDYLDITHPLYKDQVLKSWDILGSGLDKSFTLEWKFSHMGKWKYATVSGEPYEKNADGRVTKYLGYRRDTTDLVLMDESLRYSKLKSDMAIKKANMVMWEYDVEERMFTSYNEAGYGDEVKFSIEEYVNTLDPSSVEETRKAANFMDNQTVGDFSFNCKVVSLDSPDLRYITIHGSCLEVSEYDPTKATKYVGFRVDNTEIMKLTQSMEESKNLISSILAQSPSVIFIKDISDNFKYIMVNDMFNQFLEITSDKVLGKTDNEIFDKEVAQRMHKDDQIAVENGTHSLIEHVVVNGKTRSLHTTKREIKTSGRRLLVCIATEITETIEQQKVLENANRKSELVLNNANAGFVYIDNEFRVIWENIDSVIADIPYMTRYKHHTMCHESQYCMNKRCEDCVIRRASKSLKPEKETKVLGDRVVEINVVPVIDADGVASGYVCRIDNVTEAYKQKSALEKTQKYLDLAIEAGNVAVWGYDLNKKMVFNISGMVFSNDTLPIEEAIELIHPEDRPVFDLMWGRMLNEASEKETSCLRIKNHFTFNYEYVDMSMIIHRDENGKSNMIIGTYHDVTEDKLQKIAVEESRNRAEEANALLQSIIRQIPFGLHIKDISNDFRYVIMNDVLAKIIGIEGKDVIGKTEHEIFEKSIADRFQQENILAASRADGELLVVKDNFEKDGKVYTFENFDTVITVANGKRLLIGVVSDVTDKDLMIKELKDAKERAEQSDKLKSAFLANMSHEIRTPLNAIVGFSELLANADSIEEKEEYSNIISVNNELLLRLIGDILDLSKIESGMIDLKIEEFDVFDIYSDIFTTMKQKNIRSNVKLILDNPYDSCMVNLDKNRFKQVVFNFMTNAVKYTADGEIKLGYEYANGGIRVYVEDTGIGISEENRIKLFSRFEKFDSFAQGTGLGLSICKAILEAQGGNIGYMPGKNGGSIFWAWFPCVAKVNINSESIVINSMNNFENQLTESKLEGENKFRILIAEDNDSNFLLIKHMLKGYDLARVVNGVEAIDSLINGGGFDIVLMDWKMPIMDGLEATEKIREFNKTIPIIAVTANTYDSDIAKITSAGCNDFVAKPLNKQKLLEIIEKYHNKQ